MNVTTVGIDMVKTVFQVHGVTEHGKSVLRRQLKGHQVIELFADMPGVPDRYGSLWQRPHRPARRLI